MNHNIICIDTLYSQLTIILQDNNHTKSTIQLYQEHVKRIQKFMSANNIHYYSPAVAERYYKEIFQNCHPPIK